ncbi:heavy-metal-associated domain-containing protein [Halalkalicoccus jeotgali]|uniref:HMA domain-containing protein n=1 Tax=Halalkalicoccus jeotgali (strain DSM 18796 / CECT 7217 / JCM 14584 / KCTC 4019 / B3) TaxID=795797 RepID=D8J3X9_HALJB|nr:heavy-metal-associated domain-containing protein [Halalkalicoccus jeotgali]ADJ15371.1 hypothetical protein HacjB3_09940 [Halalkalicoccus jeotgali B3]ELY35416.1 hypothetical protein C497_12736 [Halalkalicoccus jeotgali B3]
MARTLTVSDMRCGGCEEAVVDALRDVEGVASANHDEGTVAIEGEADGEALKAAIEEAGYTAEA